MYADLVQSTRAKRQKTGETGENDEETLADSMRATGFSSITRSPLGKSSHFDLQNLENQERYPEGLLDYESIALEGVKESHDPGGP